MYETNLKIALVPENQELNSYVAKGRITRWAEKLSALRNDGDSLCLHFYSYSSDGIPVEVYLGATKKQENIALYWGRSTDGCWGFGWGKAARNDINTEILCCCQCSQYSFCPFAEDDDANPLIETSFLGEYSIQELINAL